MRTNAKKKLVVRSPKRLGKEIRQRRMGEGWSQMGIAEQIGYSNRHVSGIERGNPHLETPGISVKCALALAGFFGIPRCRVVR